MIKFTDVLTPGQIRHGVICSSKKRLFEIIAEIVSDYLHEGDHTQCCFECLLTREKLGNSSLGNGIAMPKAKIPLGEKPIAVFLQLTEAVEYESSDNREIDLVFALLIPEKVCADYVPHLAEMIEQLQDKNLCKQLRQAQSVEEIWRLFEHLDQMRYEKSLQEPSPSDIEQTESIN
ncbi:PTS IIA-like nitrogen regulatory protein PtsN [[Haemophilus] felis]|nr:PTS IIA-like nitrogen regulatory protein PtsN [[Haemophilus] felis]